MDEPIRFLLVDDVEENLVALEALLAREGLELVRARSGTEALERLLVQDFALALIDVQMPEMDGFELAELMRGAERSKHVPIIFVTAGPRDAQRVIKGYETGAVDFLFKPIDPHILRHKTEIFFQLHAQQRELARRVDEHAQLVEQMRETLRLNEMFTAALGHDLRNPLAAILISADRLQRRASDEATLVTAKRIAASATRMTHMTEQLLDLARARLAKGIPITRTKVDLRALAERLVAEQQVSSPERAIVLTPIGNAQGSWDEGRLSQVVSNLVGNAVQHGHPEQPIEVRIDGSAPDQVTLEVRNGGVIPRDLLAHAFDPFRSGRVRDRKSKGLGLGLYIVEQIVTAHAGEVRASSDEERGTSFLVRLPRS